MFLWLVLLFVTLPVIELALLIRLAEAIQLVPTILVVVGTGVLGASLARRQGLRTWMRVQADLAEGRMPASEIVDAMLIFIAGVVLVTPGILTDAMGFALLVPPIRNWLKRVVANHFKSRIMMVHRDASFDGRLVDIEVTEVRSVPSEPRP